MKASQIGLKPLESTRDCLILTRSAPCGPLSFVNRVTHEYEESRPPPVYLQMSDLNKKRSFDLQAVQQDFKVEKNGSLKLVNDDLRERQKGVISDILKNFAALLMEGKSLVHLSLPIRIFEPRSLLDRLVDSFRFFPYYMEQAADTPDVVERVKLVLVALFAMIPHILSQWKPFNPLLGETYQGSLGPRTSVFLEQISHHPPVSAFLLSHPQFKVYGSWALNAKLTANKLKTLNEGFATVEFLDGVKVKCHLPVPQINGTVMGQRTLQFVHSFVAFEEQSCTKGAVTFSDGKKGQNFLKSMFTASGRIDEVDGAVYRYRREAHEKILANDWYKMVKEEDKKADRLEDLCDISGSLWTGLSFGGKEYYNYEKDHHRFFQQEATDDPLPSDGRFREDLIWLNYQNQKFAQEWKFTVEAQQRADRERRKAHKGQGK